MSTPYPDFRSWAKASIKNFVAGPAVPPTPRVRLHDQIGDPAASIDAQTHADLALDEVIAEYDGTQTSFGSELFYHRLHSVGYDVADVERIIANTGLLGDEPGAYRTLRKGLGRLGRQHRGNIVTDLWNGLSYRPRILDFIVPLVVCDTVLLVVLSILFPAHAILVVLVYIAAHIAIYASTNRRVNSLAGSVDYFARGCRFLLAHRTEVGRLRMESVPRFEIFKRLSSYSILFKDGVGAADSQDILSIFLDYIRIFLCLELVSYRLAFKHIERNLEELRRVLVFIGEIDCTVNTARIAAEYHTCHPEFHDRNALEFEGLLHPLVEDCAPQSGGIDRGTIVTGMNMSGKSTFLKSLALNQLFAASFGIAFADAFRTRIYSVITSLRLDDDIVNKKSKYYVEAERLLHIQRNLEARSCLCLIDEILTGTNTDDRVAASRAILANFFSFPESLVIAATHDISIASDLSASCATYYFDGEIRGEEIVFDYALKPGIVSRRNGLLLLKFLGIELGEAAGLIAAAEGGGAATAVPVPGTDTQSS